MKKETFKKLIDVEAKRAGSIDSFKKEVLRLVDLYIYDNDFTETYISSVDLNEDSPQHSIKLGDIAYWNKK